MKTSQTAGNRTVGPIVLDNFVLDGEAVRDHNGEYLAKSQQGWEEYFAGSGRRLPTLAEYVTIIAELVEKTNTATLSGIMQDLEESALCTGTKIDYSKSNIPVESGPLDVLVGDPAWKTALQDLLQYDVNEVVGLLWRTNGERPYLWTPNAEGRKLYPERAVWLDINTFRFILNFSYAPTIIFGRARGVREVGAAKDITVNRG